MSEQKVFLALSGGVDSAVSAALLKEQGYDVTGVFMKNWSGDEFGIQADCPWEEDQADAKAVCDHLGIPFRSVNFEKEYRDRVVNYFFSEYEKGRTPNPDVMCNKEIKFKLFLEKAEEEGFDLMATGHYARRGENFQLTQFPISKEVLNSKSQIPNSKNSEPKTHYSLFKGVDHNKDQTYFIYNLSQEQLSRVLFPIGHLQKSEVRELARKFKLPNAEKPDSQGICFIGEINVLKFLMSRIPEKVGNFIDIDSGKKVGEHKGVYFYTIGQREGLRIGGSAKPYFVVEKDIEKNVVYVGMGSDHPKLFKKEVEMEGLHLINAISNFQLTQIKLEAAVRYRQKPAAGRLVVGVHRSVDSTVKFIFDEPQRAVASGQSLVIYSGEECLGGGVIR